MTCMSVSQSRQSTDHQPGSVVAYKDPYRGKPGVILGRRNASDSGMESGKDFPESNPTVENSGNDRISK